MRRANLLLLPVTLFALASFASLSNAQISPGLVGGNIVIGAPSDAGSSAPGASIVQRAGNVDLSSSRRWMVASALPQSARVMPRASLKSRKASASRNPFWVP